MNEMGRENTGLPRGNQKNGQALVRDGRNSLIFIRIGGVAPKLLLAATEPIIATLVAGSQHTRVQDWAAELSAEAQHGGPGSRHLFKRSSSAHRAHLSFAKS
jgi:hypothetical protein